jgi:anti-sigma-K factor RskA
VRYQTDLKTAQLQIASFENGVRGSEEARVKAEADAATIRMQLAKAQEDAHRAANLSAQNQQMVKLLESPQLHQLALKTVGSAAGDANARVVWDNDRGLMLLAHNLPDLAENRVYQLWILKTGQPSMVNAGVVQVDSRGRGTAYVPPGDDLNNLGGVVVTDEPSSGSTVPRGNQVFIARQ